MPDAVPLTPDELALITLDVATISGAVLLLPKATILRLLATVQEQAKRLQSPLSPDLAAIEARCNAATAGPWQEGGGSVTDAWVGDTFTMEWTYNGTDDGRNRHREADEVFIAHAREDVPALLAEVRRLRAEVARLRQGPGT